MVSWKFQTFNSFFKKSSRIDLFFLFFFPKVECNVNISNTYCKECKNYLCEECDGKIHVNQNMRHDRISLEECFANFKHGSPYKVSKNKNKKKKPNISNFFFFFFFRIYFFVAKIFGKV